jgi:GTP pyrophosphokinase
LEAENLVKRKLFEKFSISEAYFDSTGLVWEELEKIYHDYCSIIPQLEAEAEHVTSKLMDAENVHSVRRRVKKPDHLIEKIIRKGNKYVDKGINLSNYKEIVTDMIGIRVLHLFKDDWIKIHDEILEYWEPKETPQVNIRTGDGNLGEMKKLVEEKGCEVLEREHGYRSVHYLIGTPLSRDEEVLIEIQVRTVFEEAWSEIDHIIRYPYDTENPLINEYLAIFNRIAGSADEMGSFIKKLKNQIKNEK